jgi:hypothetical protein
MNVQSIGNPLSPEQILQLLQQQQLSNADSNSTAATAQNSLLPPGKFCRPAATISPNRVAQAPPAPAES